ncbi:FecR domain-containing protein [Lacipirellula sp.]|uniref:FecR domain-containing protein n=1 Tax=Lacipirellula sp. TaxID=2691419 RepID=UPI003D142BFE
MINEQDEAFRRVHDLVAAKLDGAATAEELAELKQLLHDEPALREVYVEYIQDTASLRWSFAHTTVPIEDDAAAEPYGSLRVSSADVAEARATQRSRPAWRALLAVAAAAVIGVGTYLLFFAGQGSGPAAGGPAGPLAANKAAAQGDEPAAANDPNMVAPAAGKQAASVATVTRTIDALWENEHEFPELSRLQVGQEVALRSGQIELIFDTGVEVVVIGPAHFKVNSHESMFSDRGTISARVGAAGIGFTIDTPTARVIDLGTEFGVAIGDDGETEVAVFQGIVDLEYGSSPDVDADRRRLNKGEALRVGANGRVDRVMAIASDRFPVSASVRPSDGPETPIIRDVTDNIRAGDSNKFYRIVRSGLHEDSPAFVDRDHQWNSVTDKGLPLDLEGAEYVMPFNDDKFHEDLAVWVDVGQPANLYVFYSDSMDPPQWLKDDFVDTGADVGLDEAKSVYHKNFALGAGAGESVDMTFSVWKQEVREPRVVQLGSVNKHRATFGYNMYGIATAPLKAKPIAADVQ